MSATFTVEALTAASRVAEFIKATETVEGLKAHLADDLTAIDAALPGGKGVRAFATESGMSPAMVTRAAAAGALLSAFDTLPGSVPASVTGPWALTVAREADRGGIGAKGIRTAIAGAESASALWAAVGSAVKGAKADAAEKKATREARPADGAESDAVESGPVLSPLAQVLADARGVSKALAAVRKSPEMIGEDGATLAKIATALDHAAKDVQALRDLIAAESAKAPESVPV